MRKKIALALAVIVLCLLATAGFSQKKDSLVSYDTVYVFTKADVDDLKSLIWQSRMIGNAGPYTAKEVMALLNYFDTRRVAVPKQQPKK